jgi:hypothetical protein
MIYRCPTCNQEFDATELCRPAGIAGPSYCPRCRERVRVVLPYRGCIALLSLILSIGVLLLLHVKSMVALVVGTIVVWIPLSLYLNVMSFRIAASTIEKWQPRKVPGRRRTFFEWLYDRDAPRDLIDRQTK